MTTDIGFNLFGDGACAPWSDCDDSEYYEDELGVCESINGRLLFYLNTFRICLVPNISNYYFAIQSLR